MAPALNGYSSEQFLSASDLVVDMGGPEIYARKHVTKAHLQHAPAAPTQDDFDRAKSPIIATGHPLLQGTQVIANNPDTSAHITLNEHALDLETDLFKGKLLLSVRGAPNTAAAVQPGGPLACSRRMFHVAVQGSFKREVLAENMLSGQEFPKEPRYSASFMHFVFSGAAKVFANTTDVHVREGEPAYFRFPVLAAAQLINVSPKGQEPPLLEAQEDMRLWCPELTARGGGAATPDKRRRFFDTPSNLAGRVMGSEYVWTLHLHQSLIDFATYKLRLPGVPVSIDLVSLLDTQPLQIMAKDGESGEYVFNILMWSERLMQFDDAGASEDQSRAASKSKGMFKGLLSGW